jgi:hypothetical protein
LFTTVTRTSPSFINALTQVPISITAPALFLPLQPLCHGAAHVLEATATAECCSGVCMCLYCGCMRVCVRVCLRLGISFTLSLEEVEGILTKDVMG